MTLRPATTTCFGSGGGGGRRAYDAGAFSAGSQVDLAWFSGSTNREASLRAALERVAKQLALKRGRVLDFLRDGDRLQCGELTHFKFRSALSRAGVELDEMNFKVRLRL